MTEILPDVEMLAEAGEILDPLGDVETDAAKNRARVGSARPSSLLYTYGPGAIMDLPGFSVMPAGLDDWDRDLGTARTHSDDRRAAPAAGGADAPG